MDHGRRIVGHLAAHVEDLAAETSTTIMSEVAAFGPIRDERLGGELMTLARTGIALLVEVLRRRSMPTPAELVFVSERAGRRARQLVPLSAQLHAYLIANRVVGRAIRSQSGPTVAGYREALELAALAQETTLVTAMAMAEAYLETVEGVLADRERHRSELFTELLSSTSGLTEDLSRRASRLGLEFGRSHVTVIATGEAPWQHRVVDAISRAAGRSDVEPFVTISGRDIVALLRLASPEDAINDLERAADALRNTQQIRLVAGIGPAFVDLAGLRRSHAEARRALRHAGPARPFVIGPDQVQLFDEFTIAAGRAIADLVPETTRSVVTDPTMRASLEAFMAANLNVADAAAALCIHPNTLRYRLRRVAERTGRDPLAAADLFELVAASRMVAAR